MGNMGKFRFRVQIYQINYKILVLLYYTILRMGRSSCQPDRDSTYVEREPVGSRRQHVH